MKRMSTDQQRMSSIFNRWRHQINVVPQNNTTYSSHNRLASCQLLHSKQTTYPGFNDNSLLKNDFIKFEVLITCGRQFLPRDALLSAVYAVVVCLCVCVSVTLRYCIKTAKHRITQTTPHDSPMTLVIWCQISWRNSNGITPYGGDKCRWGRLKFVTFDEKRAITRKRYKIDA